VTSSSFEVLAALSLSDSEFQEKMQVKDTVPEFYKAYVEQVQEKIETNADLEFEALWKEWKATGRPISVISDELSYAIVNLNEELQLTSLWENVALRKTILSEAFPKLLIDQVGLEVLVKRVPENYVKAIFGSYLASRFVYNFGIHPKAMSFFEYIAPFLEKVARMDK
jgi:glutamate dehydrogenase